MSRAWWIAVLLFFATMLNYFDRQILSLVSPVLRVQFSMSAAQYSHLLNAFLLAIPPYNFGGIDGRPAGCPHEHDARHAVVVAGRCNCRIGPLPLISWRSACS